MVLKSIIVTAFGRKKNISIYIKTPFAAVSVHLMWLSCFWGNGGLIKATLADLTWLWIRICSIWQKNKKSNLHFYILKTYQGVFFFFNPKDRCLENITKRTFKKKEFSGWLTLQEYFFLALSSFDIVIKKKIVEEEE